MPPGWYPDPTGLPFERYWDGVRWVESTRPFAAAPPPVPTPTTRYQSMDPAASAWDGAPAAARPWYRRKAVVISAAVIGALVAISGISSALSPNHKDNRSDGAAVAATSPPVVSTSSTRAPARAVHHAAKPKPRWQYPSKVTTAVGDGSFVMPNEIGTDLQSAQDDIQRVSGDPVFFSHSHDLLGDRFQILDRDWQVCTQNVAPGQRVSAIGHVDFGVVKAYESCP
jgi:Protein of unknown function (DUF2510)